MFNVRLAGGYLYGKQLFTWLSLVVSLMASFVLSFFPLDVLDEIWDVIESVSEGFLTYPFVFKLSCVKLTCTLGLIGNITTLVVLKKSRTLSTPPRLTLMALAVSDRHSIADHLDHPAKFSTTTIQY